MSEEIRSTISPFPGMDPYLEAPDIWPDFHDALASTLRSILITSLLAPYYARLQKRSELDLLRSGQRLLPYPELETVVDSLAPDYLVLLNGSRLDPVRLPEPLPCIPIPLAGNDSHIMLDLQVAFNRVYWEEPYLRAVDYTQSSTPPLNEADTARAEERPRLSGLRA
jgi:hypothetical protein